MPQRNIFGKVLNRLITSEDLLGKDIIDSDGRPIGIVEKVLIDPETLDFVGVSIDKGFFKKGLSIGKDYIKKIEEYAVFLKIPVAYEIEGLEVFDKDGKDIGKVSGIELQSEKNTIKNLHIKGRGYSEFVGKELIIPYSYVSAMGDNIMLKHAKEYILKNNLSVRKEV